MSANAIEHTVAQRFQLERAPSFLARTASRAPIAFTHLKSPHALRGRSVPVPREAAFSFHVPLSAPFFSELWIGGKFKGIPPVTLGCAFLFDLSDNPVVSLDTPFNSVRFYVSQAALDELAYDRGLRRVGGLHARTFGGRDPIMYGLAQALAAAMEQIGDGTALFADYVALAFHDHIIHAYGGVPVGDRKLRGGLASWQIRRTQDFIDANLDGDPSIAQLASECRLSNSHFARAFMQETGSQLSDIALSCGFADQSHFARVFSQSEGHSPGMWRRLHRS